MSLSVAGNLGKERIKFSTSIPMEGCFFSSLKQILQFIVCGLHLSCASNATTVEALVSDHLGKSEKWSQLELVAYEKAGSRKRSHDETIESARLQQLSP